MEQPKPPKPQPIRSIRAEGNNPIDLASQVAERVGTRGVHALNATLKAEKLKDRGAPQTAKSAWEREQALGRGSQAQAGGNMRMIKVRSNAYRGKTDLIEGVILHYNDEGVAQTPEGNREILEAYAVRRPGRIKIEDPAPLAPTQDELLAAAKAAMAAQASVVAPVVEAPVAEPVVAAEEVVVKEEPVSVGREAVRTETPAPKKASKKK